MSKIQDALRQIQDASRPTPKPEDEPDTSDKLATITTRTIAMEQVNEKDAPAEVSVVEQYFAELDRDALRAAGLIAPENEERKLADEYRQIKRPLIANAFGKRAAKVEGGQLIMVASALPGDGKTFTCINLALSLAQEKDYDVVLVDADVAKPHISQLFNLQDHKGLLDLIEDPTLKLDQLIVRTDVPGLKLVPSGRSRAQATELLASSRMDEVIAGLLANHPNRIVLFDSPPLLITSESTVLAGLMGQILVVVKAGATPQAAIEEAVGSLDPAKAVNLVLNQAKGVDRPGYWGNYYQGYGSAYGSDTAGGQAEDAKTSE